MRKVTILLLVVLTTALAGFAQKEKMKMKQVKANTSSQKMYTCPMHPDVLSNKPGKCPKCGMELIEKKAIVKSKKGKPKKV